MSSELSFLRDLAMPLLGLLTDAGAGWPALCAFGLLLGRRGHAGFCLGAGRTALRLAQVVALSGLLYYPLSFYLALPGAKVSDSWLALFFSLPGRPWSGAWLAWILGLLCLAWAGRAIAHVQTRPADDRVSLSELKPVLLAALTAAFCFAASFFLINWPFAGLPAELSFQRVLVAVLRNAFRHSFLAFSAAGALALVCAPFLRKSLRPQAGEMANAFRWCAIWAWAPAIPSAVTSLGLFLGIVIRGNSILLSGPGAAPQLYATVFGLMAIFCWIWCFWRKVSGPAAWLGLLLLCCKALARLIG